MLTVSVVIPLFNHSAYIERAVLSVTGQTVPVHELIVVDDGSTDNSVSVMKDLCHKFPEIVFWRQPNQGAHQAINNGVHRATGDLVAILNSDDEYRPNRLELCVECLRGAAQVQAVFTGIDFIDETGKSIQNNWYLQALNESRKIGDLGLGLLNGNYLMTTSNLVIRRSVFRQIGYFAALRYHHDHDFFLRLVTNGLECSILDEPLLRYRMHSSNTINENSERVRIEWAAVAASYLLRLSGRFGQPELPWGYLERYMDIIERHNLARLVMYFLTYFQQSSKSPPRDIGFFLEDADFYALAKGKLS
jgi:glycosyltransferase involved in cell wall biosynthesis